MSDEKYRDDRTTPDLRLGRWQDALAGAATASVHTGDCLDLLRGMPDCSVDSIVTDPPYGLAFMGKRWDYDVPSVEIWTECLRVLKPGGHLLAFAGTRTQHRMAVRIEDAGFGIRDMIAWVYGSGFPKSLDVGKAIDKAAGAEREVVGVAGKSGSVRNSMAGDFAGGEYMSTAPATPEAQQWQGWGTALKPALEPITVARKPLEGAVAANVLEHGTGGLNVDGCRVGTDTITQIRTAQTGWRASEGRTDIPESADNSRTTTQGRWPANLIHDGSDEVVGLFPDARSSCGGGKSQKANIGYSGGWAAYDSSASQYYDTGSAARFFYCAKASKADRDEGCEGLEERQQDATRQEGSPGGDNPRNRGLQQRTNHHPTVKPTALMRYLCRLVTPPGGVVLDPFTGSGSTGRGAILEGFRFVGAEMDPGYAEIARARIAAAMRQREAETAQGSLF